MRILILFMTLAASTSFAKDHYNFWPRIPFNIQGANLCEFRAAYSQTRAQYMNSMVGLASELLWNGSMHPAQDLMDFNRMYEQNLAYARLGLGVTLESTFKAYLDEYYRKLKPKKRKLMFKHLRPIVAQLTDPNSHITNQDVKKIDLIAHGTYSMSPDCKGNVIVTMSILGRDGYTKEYMGSGRPSVVMSQIASTVFEDYQRTTFPTKLKIGQSYITLLGGLNGDIDSTTFIHDAPTLCQTVGGRLPTAMEYKVLNSYGSWSGGVSLGNQAWAMDRGNVFYPLFARRPVRSASEINDKTYYYICVK